MTEAERIAQARAWRQRAQQRIAELRTRAELRALADDLVAGAAAAAEELGPIALDVLAELAQGLLADAIERAR